MSTMSCDCSYVVSEYNMYSYNCVARLVCMVQLWKLHARLSVCTAMASSVCSSKCETHTLSPILGVNDTTT